MKVYVIQESHVDRQIRGVCASQDIASKICGMFPHLGLYFEEFEIIDKETLNRFLEPVPSMQGCKL